MNDAISYPTINSPYRTPIGRCSFLNEGIVDCVLKSRRENSCFVPAPRLCTHGTRQEVEYAELTAGAIKNKDIRV